MCQMTLKDHLYTYYNSIYWNSARCLCWVENWVQRLIIAQKCINKTNKFTNTYENLLNLFMSFDLFVDPRTKPWLLSGSPGPLFTILGTYLYFCLYAGPKYMKDRKPFELKNTLIVYNIVQVILSVVLVIEVSFLFQNELNWFNLIGWHFWWS